MINLLSRHRARTFDPEEATLFIVPVFPRVSHDVHQCQGTDHPTRMQAAVDALQRSPYFVRHRGRDHMVVTNNFQVSHLGPMRELMRNGTVAWFEQPKSNKKHGGPNKLYAKASWRCTVVVPYPSSSFCRSPSRVSPPSGRDPTSTVFFQGSVDAGRGVRAHLAKLASYPGADIATASRADILEVTRNRSGNSDIGSRYSARGTALGMLRSNFCLVPKGDTPTSARIYSAVACGCVPIIISNEFKSHQPFPHVLPPSKHFWNLGLPRPNPKDSASTTNVPRPLYIMEAKFMEDPGNQLDIKLHGPGGLIAHLPQLRQTLEELAPDIIYDVEDSRVGHNLLLEWKVACSTDETVPVKGANAKVAGAERAGGRGSAARNPLAPGAKGKGGKMNKG